MMVEGISITIRGHILISSGGSKLSRLATETYGNVICGHQSVVNDNDGKFTIDFLNRNCIYLLYIDRGVDKVI